MLDMLIAPNNTSLGALSGWTKWIGASDIVINSQNEARSDGGIVKYLNDVDLGSGGVDVSVPFRNTLANNGIGGVLIHSDPSNPSDGYFAYYSGGTLSLYKSVSNVSTLLGSSPLSVPAQIVGEEDYLRYTEDGAGNHEVFFAGESKITAVDTTYTSGQVGIRLDNADFRVASFEAIPFAGAGDTVKPVITLNAPAIVTLEIGDTYTQAPATATDNVDGSITVDVGGDTVVTTGVNSFTATFDATDAAGNVATQVTQTINVIEPISA
ncbi:immunoglobulin-like domain-containing protein, partial [Neptunomonas japonica]|uniref:immunoglobulin-like domain-containing protein n=1 Tax=Neptunomonas japonica TaxID=417574 RepID=UPI00055B156A